MRTKLKLSASEQDLVLNPEIVSCVFEKEEIKVFKFHFQMLKSTDVTFISLAQSLRSCRNWEIQTRI